MSVEISLTVIAVCIALITIGVIPVLLALRRTFVQAERLVEQVRMQTAPLVHDATQIAGDLRHIVKTMEKELPKVSDSIESIRRTAADVHEFEIMVRERIEQPLLDLTAIIAGLSKGLVIFWRTLAHKK
ncbi:MAG TPA: DUF948 domain-containing protein [Bacteroidetes bacterium]|nr:DUF948 domain-containing protein [Bacteroidota bacterium]